MAIAEEGIGSVFLLEEQYPEALKHFTRSGDLNRQLNYSRDVEHALANRAKALWPLGRLREAQNLLEQATEIASRTNDRAFQVDLDLTEAELALARIEYPAAARKTTALLQALSQDRPDLQVEASIIRAEAETESGNVAAGLRTSHSGWEIAKSHADPTLTAQAQLSYARSALHAGQNAAAEQAALEAEKAFSGHAQYGSDWLAWLTAAAAHGCGGAAESRQYAAKAAEALAQLERSWSADDIHGYESRPDVAKRLKMLHACRK